MALAAAGCSEDTSDLTAGPIDGGTADSGPTDAVVNTHDAGACMATDGGAPAASRQLVRFNVTNTSSVTWFLAEQGSWCTAFEVAGLVLLDNGQPECEGPAPPGGTIVGWRELAPGAQATLTWDARRLVASSRCVDCAERGWSGGMVISIPVRNPVPAPAGAYTARFDLARTLDERCEPVPGGTEWTCPFDFGGGWGGGYGPATLCEAERVVEASFSLPAAGDLDVPVSLQ